MNRSGNGFVGGLLLLATVAMIVLKLAGVIAWPWLAVFAPLLVLVGLALVGLGIMAVVWVALALYGDRPRRRR